MSSAMEIAGYGTLLTELKTRIYTAQYVALRAFNKERIVLCRDIGKLIEKHSRAFFLLGVTQIFL